MKAGRILASRRLSLFLAWLFLLFLLQLALPTAEVRNLTNPDKLSQSPTTTTTSSASSSSSSHFQSMDLQPQGSPTPTTSPGQLGDDKHEVPSGPNPISNK